MNGHGEEITASLFADGITTVDTWEIYEGWLDNAAFALCGLQQTFSEPGRLVSLSNNIKGTVLPEACICHRKSSRSSTILGLDYLITTELDTCIASEAAHPLRVSVHTVDKSIKPVFWDPDGWLGLTEQRNNRLARMSTNDWDNGL